MPGRDEAVLRELRAIRRLLEQRLRDEEGPVVPLMSVDDVSQYLGIPMGTLYGWRTKGEGPPSYRVGKYVRYRRVEIDIWLQTLVEEAPAAGFVDPAALPPLPERAALPARRGVGSTGGDRGVRGLGDADTVRPARTKADARRPHVEDH